MRETNFSLFSPVKDPRPRFWAAAAIARAVRSGQIKAEEVCADLDDQIQAREPEVRAWEHYDGAALLTRARELDSGARSTGTFAGVPVAVKDVFNTMDMPTTMGSELWRGFTPGNDARVIYDFKREGALVQGKTVTAEFAVHHLSADKTVNPHDPRRIPGTSSSGSAAAVAAFMSPVALGTQTAGSIIRPASYCGVIGFKPTFGTVPRTGVLKTTDTLDSIGCFARTLEDIELCFEAIRVRGRDYPLVHEKLQKPTVFSADQLKIRTALTGLRVEQNFAAYTKDAFAGAVNRLASGPQPLDIMPLKDVALLNEIHPLHAVIYDKTLSYYFQKESEQFDRVSDVMREMMERGAKIALDDYSRAIVRQAEIRSLVTEALRDVDLLLVPAVAGEAPLIGEPELPDTCLLWTFLGFPALTLPLFRGPNGLPIGLQIVGKRYDDYKVLEFAKLILRRFSAAAEANT